MDALSLARKMQGLALWLDENCAARKRLRGYVESAIGFLHHRPAAPGRSRFLSGNFNRVYLCGRESGMDAVQCCRPDRRCSPRLVVISSSSGSAAGSLTWSGARLARAAASRAFPMFDSRRCLRDGALRRRRSGPDLDIREVTQAESWLRDEARRERCGPGYLRSAGKAGLFHYLAFDGARPVRRSAWRSSTAWHTCCRRPQ